VLGLELVWKPVTTAPGKGLRQVTAQAFKTGLQRFEISSQAGLEASLARSVDRAVADIPARRRAKRINVTRARLRPRHLPNAAFWKNNQRWGGRAVAEAQSARPASAHPYLKRDMRLKPAVYRQPFSASARAGSA